jgi:GNAT superfamily N-acetyltransferase
MTATLRPFTKADTDWLVALHARVYAAEEGFDETFPVLVRQILDTFVEDAEARPPPRQAGWVAEDAGHRLGSIFRAEKASDVARLRLFVLEPRARGEGLAQARMDTCLAFARDAGFRRMRLWTHESHAPPAGCIGATAFAVLKATRRGLSGRPW